MQDRRGEAVFAQGIPEQGGVDAEDGDAELRFQCFRDRGHAHVRAALHDGIEFVLLGGEQFEDGFGHLVRCLRAPSGG